VALAAQAGSDDTAEFPSLRIIITEHGLNEEDDPEDEERKLLQNRLGKLQALVKFAKVLKEHYERQIKRKGPGKKKATKKPEPAKLASSLAKPPRVITETRFRPQSKKKW